MPRTCTVCGHDSRDAIDSELVAGRSLRNIAQQFGTSPTALHRHRSEHLPAKLVLAEKAAEVADADNLLDQVGDLQRRTMAVLEAAEASHEHRTALSAIREARGNLELLAKLIGQLDERPVVNLNVSPEWMELRAVIVGALAPYTEARESVLRAIEAGGDGRA